jgi:hypothetical protein
MNRLLSYLRDKHTLWFKLMLMLGCLIFIVLILPDPNRTELLYEAGKPWENEDLIAPFDFAVYKTGEEVSSEQASIRENIPLYYTENDSAFRSNIENFFRSAKLNHQEEQVCRTAFDNLLAKQIIQLPDSGTSGSPVWILKDKSVTEREFMEFYTIAQADSFLTTYLQKNAVSAPVVEAAENTLTHTLTFSKSLTQQNLTQELNDLALIKDKRIRGQSIINRGDVVDAPRAQVLASLQKELNKREKYNNKRTISAFSGRVIYVILCLAMVFLFLGFFRKGIFAQNKQVTFIFLLVGIFVLASSIAVKSNVGLYVLPFTIGPIIIRAFFDTRTALFVHLNIILLAALFIEQKFNFIFVELLSGIAAIFSIANLTRRSQLLITAFVTLLISIAAYWSLHSADLGKFRLSDCNPFFISSACLLLAYPLIYIFEKIFGFISDFTLLELNTSTALLRQLSSDAPGTFQHSLQVANMAEEAITLIGGNALLVRAGAMYHDVGKLYNTSYFIENQAAGNNPHEELTPEESANIIIGHIIKGIELARKHKLPEQVIDFIRTHHGTTLASYFYYKAKEEGSGKLPDERKFRYPGPIPFSKETGVLMLADSVEASSRSLKSYDAVSIDDLVERIFKYKIDENQLINSDLTLRELTLLKKIFKKKLMNMYHVRIEYPKGL